MNKYFLILILCCLNTFVLGAGEAFASEQTSSEVVSHTEKNVNTKGSANEVYPLNTGPGIPKLLAVASILILVLIFGYITINKKYYLSLNLKLIICFSFLLILFMGFIAYSIIIMKSVGEEIKNISEIHLPMTTVITKITEHQLEQEINLERYLRLQDEKSLNNFKKLGKMVTQEILDAEKLAESAISTSVDEESKEYFKKTLEHLKEIEKLHHIFDEDCEVVFSSLKNKIKVENLTTAIKKCEDEAIVLEHDLVSFLESTEAKTQKTALIAEEHEVRAYNIMVALGVFCFVLGMFILKVLWSASIGLVNSVKVSAKDLNERSFNVSEAADQLLDNSRSLSEMTSQQAAAVQEMAASLEEISAMSKKSAEQAVTSTEKSDLGTKKVNEGRSVVTTMLKSMVEIGVDNKKIMDEIQLSNKEIANISNIILEISEKTKVINDIVFQTKLLSFNASVEAARAGEQGKGFAVVAEEVGNLAQMSGQAAGEITVMLTESVEKVNSIVKESERKISNLMKESQVKIKSGEETSKKCGSVFNEVNDMILEVNGYVKDIASASKEQASAVGQMNEAIKDIDVGAQNNANITSNINLSSEQLSTEAGSLKTSSGELGKSVGINNSSN